MAEKRKKLVFFTPSLERTGSEIVLFNLLPFADNFDVTVVSKYKGELFDTLPRNIEKAFLHEKNTGIVSRIINRLRDLFIVPGILKRNSKATWYINTIVLPGILRYAKEHKIPAIVHLHELEQMFALLSSEEINDLILYPELIIANSSLSADVLTRKGRKDKVTILHPGIDTAKVKASIAFRETYRQKMGLSKDDFLWVMCGTLDPNKNPLLFIEVAKELKKISSGFRMAWIGAEPNGNSFEKECRQRSKERGVEGIIRWMGNAGEEFNKYFSCADGLLLSSEYESFSMVTVEALLYGIPVVANNCGGVSEILSEGTGTVIRDKNNAAALAAGMKEYMDGKRRIDKNLQNETAMKYDRQRIGEKWKQLLAAWT